MDWKLALKMTIQYWVSCISCIIIIYMYLIRTSSAHIWQIHLTATSPSVVLKQSSSFAARCKIICMITEMCQTRRIDMRNPDEINKTDRDQHESPLVPIDAGNTYNTYSERHSLCEHLIAMGRKTFPCSANLHRDKSLKYGGLRF